MTGAQVLMKRFPGWDWTSLEHDQTDEASRTAQLPVCPPCATADDTCCSWLGEALFACLQPRLACQQWMLQGQPEGTLCGLSQQARACSQWRAQAYRLRVPPALLPACLQTVIFCVLRRGPTDGWQRLKPVLRAIIAANPAVLHSR